MISGLIAILGPAERGKMQRFLGFAVVFAILQGAAMALIVPITRALFDGDFAGAGRWLLLLLAIVAVCSVFFYLQAMAAFRAALAVMRIMHRRLGDHLVTLPLGWFGKSVVATVSQVAVRGTLFIGGAAAHLLTPVVVNSVSAATTVIVVTFFDWRLGLALAVGGVIVAVVGKYTSALIAQAEGANHRIDVEVDTRLIEVARTQPVLRACGASGRAYRPFSDALDTQATVGRKAFFTSSVGFTLNGVVVQVVLTVAIALGAWLGVTGRIDAATAVAVIGLAARFTGPLAEMADFGSAIRLASAEVSRVNAILDAQPMPEPDASRPQVAPGEVVLSDVHFGYGEGESGEKDLVLRGVDLVVPPRSMTAIIGPSGSGKSTILRLIGRFYDVDSGSVALGGVDVREQTVADVMAQLSMVFQDVYLFDDTLWENIRIGNPDASDDEVHAAARTAGVDGIAERLTDGWQTQVGEGGSRLSGGERQRVSIARALLKRAPIVLLDEATSALDTENERFILDGLAQLTSERTVIVVAHKLATVRAADQIVVLGADGRVAQRGTHESLNVESGPYADFVAGCREAAGWHMAAN